jgi:hypothetical protein
LNHDSMKDNKMVGRSIGKAKAIESGGIEVLLIAAVNNHLDCAYACVDA